MELHFKNSGVSIDVIHIMMNWLWFHKPYKGLLSLPQTGTGTFLETKAKTNNKCVKGHVFFGYDDKMNMHM